VTLAAAGDIACGPNEHPSAIACHQTQTAALLDQLKPDVVAPLGDLQYPSGRLADFRRFFGPTWGRWRSRMRPIPGNHEYLLPGGAGYFAYFGSRAGPGRRGGARRGIVQFVVGTGGENHYPIFRAKPNSLVRNNFTFGVLGLTLRSGSYAWRFVPEAGSSFTDSGSGRCH